MTASSPVRKGLMPKSSQNGGIAFLFSMYPLFTIYIPVLNVKSLCNQILVDKVLNSYNLAGWCYFNNSFGWLVVFQQVFLHYDSQ